MGPPCVIPGLPASSPLATVPPSVEPVTPAPLISTPPGAPAPLPVMPDPPAAASGAWFTGWSFGVALVGPAGRLPVVAEPRSAAGAFRPFSSNALSGATVRVPVSAVASPAAADVPTPLALQIGRAHV